MKSIFKILPIKTLCFVGYPGILALCLLPSLLRISLVPRLVYTILILNNVSANIFIPLGTLHSVKSVLGDWQSSYRRCRNDELVLCRACIGRTHLTHSYILKKDPPPQCEHCQCILTVRHILVESNHFCLRKEIYIS